MRQSILIVDDDKDLAEITRDMLEEYGYDVTLSENAEQAFQKLTDNKYSLILLDINLPDETGFEICRELRKTTNVPVIFASARTAEDDKIQGLDIGGDDYIAKPYSLKELLFRIKALLRRSNGFSDKETIYRIGRENVIEVNPELRTVVRNGTEVKMALKEFDVLNFLCLHINQIVKKEDILHEVWGAFSEAEISTVSVHIRWLREKLETNPASPEIIKTVWGIGYKLDDGSTEE